MADQGQGALVHEMLGRFIEEAVGKAVCLQIDSLTQAAQEKISGVIEVGAAKLAEALEGSVADLQTRIQKMVGDGMATLAAEAERTCQRIREESHKAVDDLPVAVQGTLLQMTQEAEMLFHRRAGEWIEQFHSEQTTELTQAVQTQMEAMRKSILEDVAQSSKALCDRNLVDFRSEFENHVHRCFQSTAQRLTAPLPAIRPPVC